MSKLLIVMLTSFAINCRGEWIDGKRYSDRSFAVKFKRPHFAVSEENTDKRQSFGEWQKRQRISRFRELQKQRSVVHVVYGQINQLKFEKDNKDVLFFRINGELYNFSLLIELVTDLGKEIEKEIARNIKYPPPNLSSFNNRRYDFTILFKYMCIGEILHVRDNGFFMSSFYTLGDANSERFRERMIWVEGYPKAENIQEGIKIIAFGIFDGYAYYYDEHSYNPKEINRFVCSRPVLREELWFEQEFKSILGDK